MTAAGGDCDSVFPVNLLQCIEKKKLFLFYLLIVFVLHLYMTLEHKTSHKGQFCEIEMYASSES